MMVYLIFIAIFVGAPICWLGLKMAPWSAPVAAVPGFFLFVIGAYAGSGHLMGFGAGLFGFAALIFVMGGGLAGR